jgi:hypothetical protein
MEVVYGGVKRKSIPMKNAGYNATEVDEVKFASLRYYH